MTRPLDLSLPSISGRRLAEDPCQMMSSLATPQTSAQKTRRRALVMPREHGAWGMFLIPLATGAVVGVLSRGSIAPVLLLTTAALALFWLRTPVESWLGTNAVRAHTKEERQFVSKVIVPLFAIATLCLSLLFWHGKNIELLWLGVLAGFVLAAQTFLKKVGRTARIATEVIGAVALTSSAAAAYYVATGRLDTGAWALWGLNWLFAADQIHFVWLRIRGVRAAKWSERLAVGWSFLLAQILLGGMLFLARRFDWMGTVSLIAFTPVLLRGFAWFAVRPQPLVIRRLGWTEFVHALIFGVLLTAGFTFVR